MHNPAPSSLQSPNYGDLIGRSAYSYHPQIFSNYFGQQLISPVFIGASVIGALSATGAITTNAPVGLTIQPTTGTSYAYMAFSNTGGELDIGIDNSMGAVFGNGNYATNISRPASTAFSINRGGTSDFKISSTGGVTITNGFGCNGKTAQTPVVSDGTLATVIVALKANGIMS